MALPHTASSCGGTPARHWPATSAGAPRPRVLTANQEVFPYSTTAVSGSQHRPPSLARPAPRLPAYPLGAGATRAAGSGPPAAHGPWPGRWPLPGPEGPGAVWRRPGVVWQCGCQATPTGAPGARDRGPLSRGAVMKVPLTIEDFLHRGAVVYADRTALIDEPGTAGSLGAITYRSLERRARGVALALDRLGVGHGERVAGVSPNAARFGILFFGVSAFGRVLVPINYRLNADEVGYIVRHSGASVLLVDRATARAELAEASGGAGGDLLLSDCGHHRLPSPPVPGGCSHCVRAGEGSGADPANRRGVNSATQARALWTSPAMSTGARSAGGVAMAAAASLGA